MLEMFLRAQCVFDKLMFIECKLVNKTKMLKLRHKVLQYGVQIAFVLVLRCVKSYWNFPIHILTHIYNTFFPRHRWEWDFYANALCKTYHFHLKYQQQKQHRLTLFNNKITYIGHSPSVTSLHFFEFDLTQL